MSDFSEHTLVMGVPPLPSHIKPLEIFLSAALERLDPRISASLYIERRTVAVAKHCPISLSFYGPASRVVVNMSGVFVADRQ